MKEDLLYKLDRGWLGGGSTDPNSLSHSHFPLSRRAGTSESEPYRRSTLIANFGGVTWYQSELAKITLVTWGNRDSKVVFF